MVCDRDKDTLPQLRAEVAVAAMREIYYKDIRGEGKKAIRMFQAR